MCNVAQYHLRAPSATPCGADSFSGMATSALQERRKRLVNRVGRHLPCNTIQVVSDFAKVATKVRNGGQKIHIHTILSNNVCTWSYFFDSLRQAVSLSSEVYPAILESGEHMTQQQR